MNLQMATKYAKVIQQVTEYSEALFSSVPFTAHCVRFMGIAIATTWPEE